MNYLEFQVYKKHKTCHGEQREKKESRMVNRDNGVGVIINGTMITGDGTIITYGGCYNTFTH